MRFSRRVFLAAGIWGVMLVSPLYFLESMVTPSITHPEYYYGFAGVTLVWQILFFVIARDPVRYRPIMLVAILEKLSYVLAAPLLFVTGRVPMLVFLTSLPDLLLATLFAAAYWKTPVAEDSHEDLL